MRRWKESNAKYAFITIEEDLLLFSGVSHLYHCLFVNLHNLLIMGLYGIILAKQIVSFTLREEEKLLSFSLKHTQMGLGHTGPIKPQSPLLAPRVKLWINVRTHTHTQHILQ